jgi:putative membrane protein
MGRSGATHWLALACLLALGGATACSDNNGNGGTGGNGGGNGGGIGGNGGRADAGTADGGGTGGAGGPGGTGGRTGTGGSTGTDGGAVGTGGSTGDAAAPDGGAPLSDAQIAAIMIEVNGAEVRAGQVANSRASNTATLAFATMMVTDHLAATGRLQIVLQSANINAADSPDRRALAAEGMQTLDTLWATPASTFDRVYLQSQVTMHTQVLQMLDAKLIPAAQNAALKSELQTERTAVMAHLTLAQQLLTNLTTDGGAADAIVDAPAGG